MNDGFGIGIEGFIRASGQLNTMVDIGAGLIFGEAMELASDGDTIDDVGMNGLFQGDSQGLLSAKDDFGSWESMPELESSPRSVRD